MDSSETQFPDRKTFFQADKRDWLLAGVVSLVVSLVIVAPFVRLGNASGHDISFHAASWVDVAGQWKEGILFPRWAEWANYGFGEPRFIFYPPLSWLLGAALVSLLPLKAVAGAFIAIVQTFAGISAYALARKFASQNGALLGAACFAANPDALLIIYVRSDYAELLAMAFYPLVILGVLRLCGRLRESDAGGKRDIGFFAVSFAAVWLANAPAAVIASYGAALVFAWAAITGKSWKPVTRGMAGLALGLALSAFYWIPAAYEQRWVNIAQALSSGLAPRENFLFTVINDAEHNHFNRVASWMAVLTLALAVAFGAMAWRRMNGESGVRQAWRALMVLGAASCLLMVTVTSPLWSVLPKLRFVQFPWRWMSILAVVFCVNAAAAIAGKKHVWVWVMAVFALLGSSAAYLGKNTWWDADDFPSIQEAVEKGQGYEGTDEYDPLGDDHLDLPKEQPRVRVLTGPKENAETKIRVEKWTAEERVVRVEANEPVRLGLRLLNYPAWQVEVNGTKVHAQKPAGTAQMLIPLGKGESRIRAAFLPTQDRNVAALVSLGGLLTAAVLLWPGRRRPRRIP